MRDPLVAWRISRLSGAESGLATASIRCTAMLPPKPMCTNSVCMDLPPSARAATWFIIEMHHTSGVRMPTYEYRCEQCRRRNAYSVRGFNPPEAPVCPHCGSTVQKRMISRVAVLRSEDARLDALADPGSLGNF